jgi:diamine N-acetyltransferase
MNIMLREVNRDNWFSIVQLQVADDQKGFVASNAFSLTQAHYEPESKLVPLGAFDGDTPVGFVMYGQYHHEGQDLWFIFRLMVDKNQQRKGYGRAIMEQAIERMKTLPNSETLYISFLPENSAAKNLYAGLGFEDTGVMDEDEIVYRLKVT